jgi:hypothetical protein
MRSYALHTLSRESQVGIADHILRALEHAFAQSVNTAAVRLG